jgi:putative transposase
MHTNEEAQYLIKIMVEIRSDHPTLSCRAMYYKILPQSIGRDKFELLCKESGFYIERKRSLHRTTDSTGVIRFDNLLEAITLTYINQAWSSDITYYEVADVFYYITFVIDCYSRKIIGHSTSKHLTTEQTTLPALRMAIKNREKLIPPGLILHSDGGGQYYDKEFLKYTQRLKIKNSMCEMAYENGKAERINGTIKNNYLAFYKISSFEELTKNVDRAVSLYNNDRPHKALKYKTPVQYEKEILYLNQQTKPKMTESFDAKNQIFGALSPIKSEQTKPQNQDVFYTIFKEIRE